MSTGAEIKTAGLRRHKTKGLHKNQSLNAAVSFLTLSLEQKRVLMSFTLETKYTVI